MNSRLRWIFLGIGLTCLIAAVVLFRNFLYVNVIMPISLILWAVLRVFMTIDQEFYWVALVFIAFIFGLRLIPMRAKVLAKPAIHESRQPARRLEYWQSLIENAGLSFDQKESLRRNLQDLLINVIAVEDQVDPNVVREDLLRKRLDVPKEIVAYLSTIETGGFKSRSPKTGWINLFISRNQIIGASSSEKLAEIGALLDFLESYAEIGYDDEFYRQN